MNFTLVESAAIDAEEWDRFVERSPQSSPYTLHHTLTILLPGWKAVIAEEKGKWEAVFPVPVKKKYGISYCFQLPWTQHSGVLFAPEIVERAEPLKRQKAIIYGLLDVAMKHCLAFDLALSPEVKYPLPFLWKGFDLKPRFTYQLDLLKKENIEDNFNSNVNNGIRKAVKSGYEVVHSENISELIQHFRREIGVNIKHLKYDHYVQLEKLVRHMAKNDSVLALEVRLDGKFAGGLILYLFNDVAYFPFSVILKEHKTSGAMSYLLLEAMQRAKDQGYRIFDFEGSVIESIERFFRSFGAQPVTYFNISRFPSWLKLAKQK